MDREKLKDALEKAIAIAIIILASFGVLALGAVRATEFAVVQFLVVVVLLLWLARLWLTRPRLLMPPTCWAILPFVGYAIWRYLAADVEYAARQELILIVMLACLFLAFVNNVYSQELIRWVVVALLAVATLTSMYGVYQWLSGSEHVWAFHRPDRGRGSGTYISPNHFAGFLEMVWPFSFALLVWSRFRALSRVLLGYGAIVIMAGIASSGSRAGWLSTAVAATALALVLLRQRRQWSIALALLITVAATGAWLYPKVIRPRFEANGTPTHSTDIRFQVWGSAWAMFMDHKWTGVGPNHFDIRYRAYRKEHWQLYMRPGHVHNDYLNTLVDWGIVGLLLLIMPLGIIAAGLFSSWRFLSRGGGDLRENGGGNRAGLALGAAIGLLAILVHSVFDFNLHIPANAVIAVILAAILTTSWRFASSRFWLSTRLPQLFVATVCIVAAAGYLSWTGAIKWREGSLLQRASDAPLASPSEIALLKQAYSVERRNFETAYAIGERLRANAWLGEPGWEEKAKEAMKWFDRALELNRWDAHSYVRKGMCLDWLGQTAEAEPFFRRALELDPNHYFVRAMMGWHMFHSERYAECIEWMNRSLALHNSASNTTAYTFRDLARKALENSASMALPTPGK